jgi:hypothetical protein
VFGRSQTTDWDWLKEPGAQTLEFSCARYCSKR